MVSFAFINPILMRTEMETITLETLGDCKTYTQAQACGTAIKAGLGCLGLASDCLLQVLALPPLPVSS